jgi:ribosomal protein S18 acetylase RimI-like enzyme
MSKAFIGPWTSSRGSGAIWRFWRRRRSNRRERSFNIEHGYPQWVALSAGEVVGWSDVIPMTRPIYAHCGVLGVGLLRQFRRQGLGEKLIRRSLAAARAFGLHRGQLTVPENNTGAIELYKKFGFAIEGLRRDAARVDDAFENVIEMAVPL